MEPRDDEDADSFMKSNEEVETGERAIENANQEQCQPSEFDVMSECDSCTYYTVCFIYLAVIVFCAMIITDIRIVFGMIAGISECSFDCIFPASIALIGATTALKKGTHLNSSVTIESSSGRALTACFVVIGVSFSMSSNYMNLHKLVAKPSA